MLLSDRDILAAQSAGHISLDPWTPEMVQPASIDVRLDRYFRLFNNHAYTYVDPAENQGALDRTVRGGSRRTVDFAPWRVRTGFHVGIRQVGPVHCRPSGRQELTGPIGDSHPFDCGLH